MQSASEQALDRSPSQFFFEVGFGAAYAQALIANDMKPPFALSDAVVEHAWDIAGEAHDDPEEFDRYLALANEQTAYTPSPAPMVEQAGEASPAPEDEVTAGDLQLASKIYKHFGFQGHECLSEGNPIVQLVVGHRTAAWNTRPAPAETEGASALVERLRELAVHEDEWTQFWSHEWPNIFTAAAEALSAPPADAGMLREALDYALPVIKAQIDKAMYAGGANRDVIEAYERHERALKDFRAAINSQAHQIREGDHG